VIAGQENDGGVGVDAFDLAAAVTRGIGEKGDDGGLVLFAHAVTCQAEPQALTLTLTLSRFAGEGTRWVQLARSSPLYHEAGES